MAVVERADNVEFGVPLVMTSASAGPRYRNRRTNGPSSEGVVGSEGGGGKLISVGVVIFRTAR